MEVFQQQNTDVDFRDDLPTQIKVVDDALLPCLERKRGDIESIRRDTLRYAPGPRHEVDVYWPPDTQSGLPPILVFVYGGAFRSGDRVFPPPNDLKYKNVGAFFARQGFVTIIPDYRLLPHMKWPDPATDVKDALVYVCQHLSDRADTSNIFITGHSSGDAIAADVLLLPDLLPDDIRSSVRGLGVFAGVMHYRDMPYRLDPTLIPSYYTEDMHAHCPTGLLASASDDFIHALPDVLAVVGKYDVIGLVQAMDIFEDMLRKRGATVDKYVAEGHNHISLMTALSTGEGEEWGLEVSRWLKARITKT